MSQKRLCLSFKESKSHMLSILNFESSVTHRAVFYGTLIVPIAGAICHFYLFGKFCFLPTVSCKSNESEMCKFRSLSSRLFKENLPENLSVFSQDLEHYFFKTKDTNSPHFRDQNKNSLA